MQHPPSIETRAFDCPHCNAYSGQQWFKLTAESIRQSMPMRQGRKPVMGTEEMRKVSDLCNVHLAQCYTCNLYSVWVSEELIYPKEKLGTLPNADLPDDVKDDFNEARGIVDQSPRGAAALLRLAIQKLCIHLGEKGKKIDDDIASLVKKGLLPMVQQALDGVRVIGNEAVHPGELDLRDNRETALTLFDAVNMIAVQMITHPKQAKALYATLPAAKLEGIEKRDAPKPPKA